MVWKEEDLYRGLMQRARCKWIGVVHKWEYADGRELGLLLDREGISGKSFTGEERDEASETRVPLISSDQSSCGR